MSSRKSRVKRYDDLPLVADIIGPDLILLFIGFNPGITTSTSGHIYSHPSNRFWTLLHTSGLTERKLHPTEDVSMPEKYQYGATNIVARPSKDISELSADEYLKGATILEEKVAKWRPEAVCIVGKSIWEAIWKNKHGRRMKASDFHYGWQDETENMGRLAGSSISLEPGNGASVFVSTSTSGLATSPPQEEKERIWRELGDWVKERRLERTTGALVTTVNQDIETTE